MSTQPAQLTLEQQFHFCAFNDRVKSMSHEESKDLLVELYAQMLARETLYKQRLKQQLGI